MRPMLITALLVSMFSLTSSFAGQPPGALSDPDVPVSHRDRVYAAEQFSNTVSVTDPATNALLGVIRLGDPEPGTLSPLYRGQVLVHGMGFSPDSRTIAVVSIGSNSVTFIDTATNTVKHTTYIGRSPHEPAFTRDGREVWVTVRGENYVSVLDAMTYEEKARIPVPNGPGMQIFSPDGQYAYICSSFTPQTVVVSVATHNVVGHIQQDSPFCPNIAATPDGNQVWFTLKDVGRVTVFDARPPFAILKTFDTGPLTNHVNFVHGGNGTFAYVSVGGLGVVKVFRTLDFAQIATIRTGGLPHGVWGSGDGSRVYVGLENGDALAVIDTKKNAVIAQIPIGQAPQAVTYVPNAVAAGSSTAGLEPLGASGAAVHFTLADPSAPKRALTTVTLFDQGLTQVLQAAAVGLEPTHDYTLAIAAKADGSGDLTPIAEFKTNPAGAAIVNAVGPIRPIVDPAAASMRRYLVIVPGHTGQFQSPVQVMVSPN